ncbi:MAG TPA: lactonase family protein [Burkholderiales bacterium]|nr:lactonase family protein [Burkholderiales bacterium]
MNKSNYKATTSCCDSGDSKIVSMQRRSFLARGGGLMVAAATGSMASGAAIAQDAGPLFAYVGCYTTENRGGRGKGISVFRVDTATAAWTPVQLLENIVNPSFLCFDREQKFLYAAHGDMDYVSAFAINPADGSLSELNREPCGGTNPVHVAVDKSNQFLVVSNYTSGSVAVMPIKPDGALGPLTDLVNLEGTPGPHRTQQASAHPHQNPFDTDGRFILVPDKGLDRIFVFRLDPASGKLIAEEKSSVDTRAGAGPRHVDFHPRLPYVYAINELDSTITTYRFDRARGELTPLQILTTLPSDFTGNNTTAEVWAHPSGRFVFGSNRGHNSIVTYFVDRSSGLLATVGWQSTMGSTPRFFGLDPSGTVLCAGNQNSDNIVNFRVDQSTGKLAPVGEPVRTGSPVTIVFRNKPLIAG